jgi:RimJ/RimL family protein N-acetyltransferase
VDHLRSREHGGIVFAVSDARAPAVRDMRADEASQVVSYFHGLSPDDCVRLGIDRSKLPEVGAWNRFLREDFERPVGARRWHYVAWELEGAAVGHSNIGDIERGVHGYMHLHIWRADLRAKGLGRAFVLGSVGRYFEVLDIQTVYCQPNAFNVAPNRALDAAGFAYLETYETVPGWLNHWQAVTRWAMTRERLAELGKACASASFAGSFGG